jgi:hypothetical protein
VLTGASGAGAQVRVGAPGEQEAGREVTQPALSTSAR